MIYLLLSFLSDHKTMNRKKPVIRMNEGAKTALFSCSENKTNKQKERKLKKKNPPMIKSNLTASVTFLALRQLDIL